MRIPRFARNDKACWTETASPISRFPLPRQSAFGNIVLATNFFPHVRSVRIEAQAGSSQAVRSHGRLAVDRVQHACLACPGRRRGGDEPPTIDRSARARGALPVLGARA